MLEDAKIITSAEFVEVNPILDERNKTATVAVALIGSLFGEKLLEPSYTNRRINSETL